MGFNKLLEKLGKKPKDQNDFEKRCNMIGQKLQDVINGEKTTVKEFGVILMRFTTNYVNMTIQTITEQHTQLNFLRAEMDSGKVPDAPKVIEKEDVTK